VDLADLSWDAGTLSGRSDVVAGDEYALYLTEPQGWRFAEAQAAGADVLGSERDGAVRVVRLRSAAGGRIGWLVRYTAAP
jgi:hypothetical protein